MVSADTVTRRTFTADEVWRMVEAGVLRPDEHVELIQGELVVVTPKGPSHSSLTTVLHRRLEATFGASFHVRDHSPVEGTVDSIPEPDVAVVRGDPRGFLDRLPGPNDVPLVVEVAHTTLTYDRRKTDVYAAAGYACCWIVDVKGRRVEVRDGLRDGVYTRTAIVGDDGALAVPGSTETVPVVDLLP